VKSIHTWLLVLTFCNGAGSLAAQCRLSSQDLKIVESLPKVYRDGWFAANASQEVMRLFSADAVILPHHGVKPRKGHAEIRQFWFPPNMASFQLLKLTMDPVEISGCGNVAYLWGNQSVEWKMKDAPQITSNAGTFLMIARKQGGKWLIDRLMWDDPPNQVR
jgi:ketosteroid isomerase-like protein